MIKVTKGAFLAFFFIKFLVIQANLDCSTLSDEPYPVTAKDFKISRKDVKLLFCSAYFCSSTLKPIRLLLENYVHIKGHSTLVYSGMHTVSLSKNCSNCEANSIHVNEGNSTCELCPVVPESRNIEIHIRIDKPSEANINGELCQFEDFFNITMYSQRKVENRTLYCKNGLNVSLPVDNDVVCAITKEAELEQVCINPSCSDGLISESISTGNILHQFPISKNREACIFNIKSDFQPVEIFFSPNIKESLIVYGSTLDSPKWNLANCDDSNSKIMIKPIGKSFFIVYKNAEELQEKGSLSIIAVEEKLCNNPPLLENGESQVVLDNKLQFLQFKCNKGFTIVGRHSVACDEAVAENIPSCIAIQKDVPLESSSQKVSNATLLELDVTTTIATVVLPASENESDSLNDYDLGSAYSSLDYDDTSFNLSSSFNASSDSGNFDLKLFTLPTFKDNMVIFILIGIGFCLIIIITIVSAVVCRNNGSCRSNSGRKFDTFQNPIYEKPVQVPITAENGELCQEKIDLGDLSDSTVLE